MEALIRRVLFLGYLLATAFYFYVRITYTLDVHWVWYSWLVLFFELWGSTSVVLYAFVLTRTGGGPEKKPVTDIKIIRALIPCYKEGLDIVKPTVTGALTAPVPEGYTKHVYLLDDGRDDEKRKWIESLQQTNPLVHYRIRPKKPNQVNGKSTNMNYTLRYLYGPPDTEEQVYETDGAEPGHERNNAKEELIAVFDADQICGHDFFMRALSAMGECALLLTPQCFHNVPPYIDVFNHTNTQFYEYMLPALDTWGCVSCTGTNYLLRSDAIKAMGYFAEDAVNEDYVLSLMLKRHGFKSKYLREYLAAGEAPEDLRNIFKQRSRWCKGHMQVMMGPRNPLTDRRLPLIGKIFYSIGNLSYLCCAFCTPIFLIIPVLTIWFGIYPIDITKEGVYAFAIYYFVLVFTLTLTGNIGHSFRLWLSTISNNMFWFTYLKAFWSVFNKKIRKKDVVFKATDKAVSVVANKSVMDSVVSVKEKKEDKEKAKEHTEVEVPSYQSVDRSEATSVTSSVSSAEEEPAEVSRSCCGFLREELGPKALKEKMTGQGGELWMNIIVLLLSGSTAVAGFVTLDTSGRRGGHDVVQIVSIFWALYNTVPCFFFLHYALFQFRGMKTVVALGSIVAIFSVVSSFVILVLKSRVVHHYTDIVDDSFLFYEAQRSGVLPESNRIPWRQDSGILDQTVDGESLVGGYYDAGDTVKFGLPMAVSTSILAWGLIDFNNGYSADQVVVGRDTVKWATDYFIRAHTAKNEFYAQVGRGTIEHKEWNRPEVLLKDKVRIGIMVNETNPGSDVAGSTAAALAAASILFREVDFDYSEELLEHAIDLQEFARKFKGFYSDSIPDAEIFYKSNEYRDDLAWGAMWLHLATEEQQYLDQAKKFMNQLLKDDLGKLKGTAVDWNNVAQPACLLLYRVTSDDKYKDCVEDYVEHWTQKVTSTPNGLAYIPNDQKTTSLRDAANSAMIAMAYANEMDHKGRSKTKRWTYECWGMLQIRYMLGDGGDSFVVGYGKDYPKRIHHRGATCPDSPDLCDWAVHDSEVPNRHTLVGALVGGPDEEDVYKDERWNIKQSEVALDYNAAFTGALARLARIQSHSGFGQCYHGDGVVDWFRVIDLPN